MANTQDDYNTRIEIQKLLKKINQDMINLKSELSSTNDLIKENTPFPITVKMVNEKLVLAAQEAGIDLLTIGNIREIEDDGDDDSDEGEDDAQESTNQEQPKQSNIEQESTNVDQIAAATEKLTVKMKRIMKK